MQPSTIWQSDADNHLQGLRYVITVLLTTLRMHKGAYLLGGCPCFLHNERQRQLPTALRLAHQRQQRAPCSVRCISATCGRCLAAVRGRSCAALLAALRFALLR